MQISAAGPSSECSTPPRPPRASCSAEAEPSPATTPNHRPSLCRTNSDPSIPGIRERVLSDPEASFLWRTLHRSPSIRYGAPSAAAIAAIDRRASIDFGAVSKAERPAALLLTSRRQQREYIPHDVRETAARICLPVERQWWEPRDDGVSFTNSSDGAARGMAGF